MNNNFDEYQKNVKRLSKENWFPANKDLDNQFTSSNPVFTAILQEATVTTVGVPSARTSRVMEHNADIRAKIERTIMEVNVLQDDLIEKYLSVESPVRRTTRDVWDLRRRFSIISSSLRRLKEEFIPKVEDGGGPQTLSPSGHVTK